jgi:Protein of unknown function (DUF3102)
MFYLIYKHTSGAQRNQGFLGLKYPQWARSRGPGGPPPLQSTYLGGAPLCSKSVKKTRAQWANEIIAAHKASIEGIFKMGRTLIAARRALNHGEFEKMIQRDLLFDASTAQRLMKIARHQRLRNAAGVQVLP